MNKTLFTMVILKYLVPLFGKPIALFIFNLLRAHLTPQVIEFCKDYCITPSLIPAGTTLLTQPLDAAMNKPFKVLIIDFTEELREEKEEAEDIEKWTVSQQRVVTMEPVSELGRSGIGLGVSYGKRLSSNRFVIPVFLY